MKLSKKAINIILIIIMVLGIMPASINTVPAELVATELPVVAIHVSDYTKALHGAPGSPAPSSDVQGWYYDSFWHFQVYTLLEEALRADGTPFVEVTDSDIENGRLVAGGKAKYPILFSLMAEAVSDLEVSKIKEYVTAGGCVYASGSWGTRAPNGIYRMNAQGTAEIAIANEIGLTSMPTASKPQGGNWSWALINTIRTDSGHELVSHLPNGQNLFWPLPKKFNSDANNLISTDNGCHWAWVTKTADANPATALATITSAPGYTYTNIPLLTSKNFGDGLFLYHAEMAPLAGWGGFTPDTYEYLFFRKAIELAFERHKLPLTKTAAWRYPYKAALQTRWDCDFYPGDIRNLVPIEKNRGVQGQYYIVTSLPTDGGNWAIWARNNGAIIGSHNDTHVGPDTQDAANAGINLQTSLDKLETWLGARPNIWVSPKYQSITDQSFQILVNNGIKTAGEQNIGPFPHFTLSMTTEDQRYDLLQVPTSEWLRNSNTDADARARMERFPTDEIINAVDFYYDLGGVINIYGHPYATNEIRVQSYVDRAKEKGDVWLTNSMEIYTWWKIRDRVSIAPQYSYDGQNAELQISVGNSSDADQALDITIPDFSSGVAESMSVILDGNNTTDYSLTSTGIKIKAGLAQQITVRWMKASAMESFIWTQDKQADFEQGTLQNLDSTNDPGVVKLAAASGCGPFYWSDFSVPDGLAYGWSNVNGVWAIKGGIYAQSDLASGYKLSHTGNSGWSDYVVEANSRLVNGVYGGQLSGRLNPATGARYSLWLYPGSNELKLIKFTNWTNWTQLGQTITIPAIGTSWHRLKLGFAGSRITAYYDDILYCDVVDTSYSNGAIALETYGSEVSFDNVKVSVPGMTFVSEGSLLSVLYDSGSIDVRWGKIFWTCSTAPGTSIKFRTRTAISREELINASWSDYQTASGTQITSENKRWIQYEATLATNDINNTPVLDKVSIEYQRPKDLTPPSPPSGVNVAGVDTGTLKLSWVNPLDSDFDHIHVYRSTTSGTLGGLIYDGVTGTEKIDPGLINGITYFYTIKTVDKSGNESTNTNQYPGTPSGGSQSVALSFDPFDDYVLVPDSPSLDVTGSLTVEAFVYVNSFAGKHGIIASRWDGSDISWDLYYDSGGRIFFYVRKPDNSGYVQTSTSTGVLTKGSWHHIAGVLNTDTDELSIYIDGTRRSKATFTYSGARTGAAKIGINAEGVSSGGTLYGDAKIDEVRMSNSARYSGSTYSVPMTTFADDINTVALWHFNEGIGNKAYDSSANANHGDLKGDPEWVPTGYPFRNDVTPPSPPNAIQVTGIETGGALKLTWVNPTDSDFNHIHIYRSTTSGTLGGLIHDGVNGTEKTDSGLINGITYFYTLKSVDSSGNETTNTDQHSGTPNGGSQSVALSFDPTDDYILVPDSPSLDVTGALTVEASVNVNSFAGKYGIIASRWDGSDISWELYYDASGRVYFYTRRPDNIAEVQAITGSGALTIGSWHHVAGVLDPITDELSIYIDGARKAKVTFIYSGARTGAARIDINAEPTSTGATQFGDAKIDEVRISNSARYSGLTFSMPLAAFLSDINTVALWHFNEGIGNKAYDSSANANHGDLKGDPEWEAFQNDGI